MCDVTVNAGVGFDSSFIIGGTRAGALNDWAMKLR